MSKTDSKEDLQDNEDQAEIKAEEARENEEKVAEEEKKRLEDEKSKVNRNEVFEVTKFFMYEGSARQPGDLVQLPEDDAITFGHKIKKLEKRTKVVKDLKTK